MVQSGWPGLDAESHRCPQRRAHRVLRPCGVRLLTIGAELTRWRALWRRLGARGEADAAFDTVMREYRSEDRAYHTPRHLEECLEQLDAVRGLFHRPDEAEAAIWFHDAIYDPRADDNEERSADLADRLLRPAGVPTEYLAEIRRLILATGHRGSRDTQDDATLITDIDLTIFGSAPERFDEYERDIRREYAFAADDEFRRRRAQILESFLARPTVYATHAFADRFETRARDNLRRSVAALRSGRPAEN